MQLRVEGGDILKKLQTSLDDFNLKDRSVIIVDIVDKQPSTQKAKKPVKEEPRISLSYVVKSGDSEEKDPVIGKSEVWRSMKIKQLRKTI